MTENSTVESHSRGTRLVGWQRVKTVSLLARCLVPLLLLVPTANLMAQSGTQSGGGTVGLTATRTARLSVAIVSGATVTLPGITDNALNPFPTGASLRTRWTLQPIVTNGVALVAYFTSPANAMVNGTATIPSSRILARLNAGAYQPVVGNAVGGVGTAGGSLQLFAVDFGFLNLFNTTGDRTDQLDLQLDLRGAPRTRAGVYVGTLNIRAVAL